KDDEIQIVENKLNDRPRKLLKYKTPNEVFYEYQNK
ncbi:MAG: IS30 family transposase, partial [Candidatus Cloacimonetes bacterium]|nr:IS30 family transposase [Candidatus Cloacimonadota bacterium]